MSECPYRNREELIGWLIRYKGYTRYKADKLSDKQLWYFYYNSEKIFNRKRGL